MDYSDYNRNYSEQSLSSWSKLDHLVCFSQLGLAIYLPMNGKILVTDNNNRVPYSPSEGTYSHFDRLNNWTQKSVEGVPE